MTLCHRPATFEGGRFRPPSVFLPVVRDSPCRRTVAVEAAVRQTGDSAYVKAEFSAALASHWRVTFAGVGLAGDENDFIGQFHRNSNASVTLRLSF